MLLVAPETGGSEREVEMKGNVNDDNSRGGVHFPKRWSAASGWGRVSRKCVRLHRSSPGATGLSPVGQVGCWAFWFWSNLQQLDTRKDSSCKSWSHNPWPQPSVKAEAGGKGWAECSLEGPREAVGLGKDSLLSDSSSRPCKELKPSL